MSWDVILLGLGAMGSATAFHLAKRGKRVLAIEQFASPHDQGSSHGGSRIIRQAYWEGAEYIPLVSRAYELWREVERNTGSSLLHITGGAVIGSSSGPLVSNTISAARQYSIPIDILDPSESRRRFPQFALQPDDLAIHEPGAGYLVPEDCIRAHLQLASRAGAALHFDEKVLSSRVNEREVRVTTTRGTYSAGHLVVTAGPWANEALAGIFPLRVTRQVMAWVEPSTGIGQLLPDRFPIYVAEDPRGGPPIYGFPAIDGPSGGAKAAIHGSDNVCTPDTIDRAIHPTDLEQILEAIRLRIPSLNGPILRAKTCLYTMTPDEHFIIGRHPQLNSCTIACGFSGHGFKFSSVVGEVLADLAIEGSTPHPIALFSPQRFTH